MTRPLERRPIEQRRTLERRKTVSREALEHELAKRRSFEEQHRDFRAEIPVQRQREVYDAVRRQGVELAIRRGLATPNELLAIRVPSIAVNAAVNRILKRNRGIRKYVSEGHSLEKVIDLGYYPKDLIFAGYSEREVQIAYARTIARRRLRKQERR